MKQHFVGLMIFIFAACTGSSVLSDTALTVVQKNGDGVQELTLQQLQEFRQVELRTGNEFVDGEKIFRGPLAREVLQLDDSDPPEIVILTAANDYQVEVSTQEFQDYDVILALSMDDKNLSRRDKGPIWVIYPMSDHEELRDPVYNSRLIWQLVKMEVK